nr:site-specific integrase [uncultured Anaerocolumna sp.]
MAVQEKNGRYYAAVYLGIKEGKQEYDWSDGFDTKEEAQLAELEMRKNVILSGHKVYNKESFPVVAERWLKMRETTVAKTTYRSNKNYYNTYIKEYFADSMVKEIDTPDVFDFMMQIEKSPATINKAMNVLSQIFDFAITLKQIRANPCVGVKKPSIKKTKKKTWDEKTIGKFLSLRDVKNSSAYTAYLILFSTGMRPGEVCGLRWCDWIDDYFIPTVGIDDKREETYLKNDKAHDNVYLDQRVILQLKRTKLAHEAIYRERGLKLPEDGYINCLMPDFRPMTDDYLRKTFHKLCERNGIPKIRMYDSRHSFGTNMMRNKVNPKKVAEMMRHTSVKTTLDNYSHVDKEMYKNTSKAYNDKIFNRAK